MWAGISREGRRGGWWERKDKEKEESEGAMAWGEGMN